MELITKSDAGRSLAKARSRIIKAQLAVSDADLRLLQTQWLADLEGAVDRWNKAHEELKHAYEWYGECYYVAHGVHDAKIEATLKDARDAHRMLVQHCEYPIRMVTERFDTVFNAFTELRAAREKVEKLLASHGEGWFYNG
jgi:hypothetical protein